MSENEKKELKKSGKLGMNCHVGKITHVYFGEPYAQTTNYKSVLKNSKPLRKYNYLKNELKLVCDTRKIHHEDFNPGGETFYNNKL